MKRLTLTTLAALIGLAAAPAAAAPSFDVADRVRPAVAASAWQEVQRQISPQEAVVIARRRVPGGEVVDIRRTAGAYRVRIIARDGRVVDIVVDATTGRVR